MIQQKQTELNEIVDGGNTDNTVSDVQNSNPDEALKLRNSLLEKSPNLSDTVMITTITEENILPKIMLTEVLTANSQSAKSENVTQALDNRDDQLPNYLRDEINTGRDSISTKEELEISIFELKNKKARIYNEKVRYFLTDTVQSSKDSLLYLLENENNLTGKYRLLSYYISKKDHVNAEIVLNSIETEFELTARQQVEYDKMVIFTNIQLNLFENNKTYFEVDSIQRQKLYLLSEDTLSQAGTYARSVISLIDRVEYDFNFSFPENKPKDFAPPPSQPELIFNLTPNPAKDYFVAEYELPLSNFTNARFTMYNYDNVKVYERTLNKRAYQLLVETEEFIPGTYICKLNADGKEFTQKLITIKADQMTNEQTEHSEQIKNSELQNVTNYLAIFPNPANDFVVVKYNFEDRDFTIGNIIFTDNTGKTVKTEPIATNTRQQTISTTDLAKGMYNISIQLDGIIIETNKVIIE